MAGLPSLCHSTLDSSPTAPGTGVGLWGLAGIRNNSQCLWEIHSGHLHQVGKGKKAEPCKPGQCLVLSAGLPPSPPPALGITSSMKPNSLSCLWDFQRLNAPLSKEQVWAAERARRRRRNVKSIFSLLAELFDLDIAFLRITEILIK